MSKQEMIDFVKKNSDTLVPGNFWDMLHALFIKMGTGAGDAPTVVSTANLTVNAEINNAYVYTGPGGNLTLPDPTTVDTNTVFYLSNFGTGTLIPNYALYYDNSNSQSLVGFANPDNRVKFKSDSTRYIVVA